VPNKRVADEEQVFFWRIRQGDLRAGSYTFRVSGERLPT
jgi:hypothetical protein